MINLSNRKKVLLAPLIDLVEGLIKHQDEFLEELAKELMLDELLCGEGDPKQFLIESMNDIIRRNQVEYHRKRIEKLTGADYERS